MVGLVAILIGFGLLMNTMNILPFGLWVGRLWMPSMFILVGVWQVSRSHGRDGLPGGVFFILFGATAVLAKNSVQLQQDFKPNWKNAAFCMLLMAIGIISLTKVSEFIYFNF